MANDSIQKVLIRMLAIVICFPVHESAHAWVAEPGEFQALLGFSSEDIQATLPFTLK